MQGMGSSVMKKLFAGVLACMALLAPSVNGQVINEIDWDPAGTDTAEYIEIAAPGGTNLTGWSVELYNGSGGARYGTIPLGVVPLDGYLVIGNPVNAYVDIPWSAGTYTGGCTAGSTTDCIQNGAPDAVALCNGAAIVQTVSYEGTFTATGAVGCAIGMSMGASIGDLDYGTGTQSASLCPDGVGPRYQTATTLTPGVANSCPAAPANDDCSGALTAMCGTTMGNNSTTLLGDQVEPACSTSSNRDMWYDFVAPATANVTVNTEGSVQTDTILSVHGACGGASIACDDDSGTGNLSALTFAATMGTSYKIRVASFGATAAGGAFNVNIICAVCGNGVLEGAEQCDDGNVLAGDGCSATCTLEPPANEDCSGALMAGCGTTMGNNAGSVAPDMVEASCQASSNKDVWYKFTAPTTGTVTVDTEGSTQTDTVLSLYGSCGGLEIVCDDDGGTGLLSRFTFSATMGTMYWIRLASFGAAPAGGAFRLNITCPVCGDGLVEGAETCDDGNVIDCDGCDGNCTLTACGNGIVCAPEMCDTGGNSMTCDSDCTDVVCGDGLVNTVAGEMCDDGNMMSGDGCSVTCQGEPPANDDCINRLPIMRGTTNFTTAFSTTDGPAGSFTDPPCTPNFGAINVFNDVWFNYTAPCDGNVTIDLSLSAGLPDTRIEVYLGCGCPVMPPLVVCDDDDGAGLTSLVTFAATLNQCYKIRIGSFTNGVTGPRTAVLTEETGACCNLLGGCSQQTSCECQVSGGTFLGNGSACLGDLDMNGIDDACVAGACCTYPGNVCVASTAGGCAALGGIYQGDGSLCAMANCAAIPTVSEWGVLVMSLLLVSVGTIVFARRRAVAARA